MDAVRTDESLTVLNFSSSLSNISSESRLCRSDAVYLPVSLFLSLSLFLCIPLQIRQYIYTTTTLFSPNSQLAINSLNSRFRLSSFGERGTRICLVLKFHLFIASFVFLLLWDLYSIDIGAFICKEATPPA